MREKLNYFPLENKAKRLITNMRKAGMGDQHFIQESDHTRILLEQVKLIGYVEEVNNAKVYNLYLVRTNGAEWQLATTELRDGVYKTTIVDYTMGLYPESLLNTLPIKDKEEFIPNDNVVSWDAIYGLRNAFPSKYFNFVKNLLDPSVDITHEIKPVLSTEIPNTLIIKLKCKDKLTNITIKTSPTLEEVVTSIESGNYILNYPYNLFRNIKHVENEIENQLRSIVNEILAPKQNSNTFFAHEKNKQTDTSCSSIQPGVKE